jgi:hypothetical protein
MQRNKTKTSQRQAAATPSQLTGYVNQLLAHPMLLALLVLVCGILVLLTGGIVYLLWYRTGNAAVTSPTPASAVSFVTSTPPLTLTVTTIPGGGASPSIGLLPVQGEAGTLVTITGRNWPPNDAVLIRLEDPTGSQGLQPLQANTTVTGSGTFVASILLPANTGWSNLTAVQVIVEATPSGLESAAQFSIVAPNPVPTSPLITQTLTPLPSDDDDDDDYTPPPPLPTSQIPPVGSWQAEYFNNPNLIGPPALARNEVDLNFGWGFGAPAPGLPLDGFSARWFLTTELDVGFYRFYITADDGVRLWIDNELVVDDWYATARRSISVEYFVRTRGLHDIRLEYTDFSGDASLRLTWEKVIGPPPPDPDIPYFEWRGAYWANLNLFGDPVFLRGDPSINFDWGNGSPDPGIPADNFSVRWERIVDFEPVNYRFYLTVDDGARVWLDGYLLIDEWRDGNVREITRDYAISGGPHLVRVEYYERNGQSVVRLRWDKGTPSTPTSTPISYFPDWQGEYWSNLNLTGSPLVRRNDPQLNFNWAGGSPDSAIPADNFSARWSRSYTFENGLYRFTAETDDGLRFYIDGALVLNEWHDTFGPRTYTVDLNISGQHNLVVEYYERAGDARLRFNWERLSPTPTPPLPTLTPTFTSTPSATPTVTATATPTLTPVPTITGTLVLTPTVTATTSSESGSDLPDEIPSP